MSADPSLFVFGHLATPEHLAEEARRNLAGLFHGSRLAPPDPAPGEPVTILAEAAAEVAVDEVVVRYTTDSSSPLSAWDTVPARLVETRWDDLAWRYVDRWLGTIPGQPEGTSVRYLVEGVSNATGARLSADSHPAGAGPDNFGYQVDRFSAPSWVHDAIIYQIFVDRFYHTGGSFGRPLAEKDEIYGGTLDGITARLDYLSNLGINALWLTPIFSSETYHAYDALDYAAVAERLGGPPALWRLVREAHARGIRVLLDFAANHCSWHNPMFLDAQRRPDSPYRHWFTFDRWPTQYRSFFGVRLLPQLNTHNPEVVAYLSEIASSYLVDYDVDGFRLDYALGPPLLFWSDFRAATKTAKPDSYTVGEVTLGPGGLRQFEGRLDGCLDFPTLQAFRRFFLHRTLDAAGFHSILRHGDTYFQPDFTRPTFLDNHDMNRFLWSAGNDVRKLKLAAVCQFSLPQPPIIYYGTEVGLSQKADVAAGFGFAAARLPMLWDGAQDLDLLEFYRILIRARHDHPALRAGQRHLLAARGGIYAYRCQAGSDLVTVVVNNTDEACDVSVGDTEGIDLLSGVQIRGQARLGPLQAALVAASPADQLDVL